jgi:HEAT repeat protein
MGEPALAALREALDSAQADRRWWALRALAEIDFPQVPEWLAGHLPDPEPAVRHCAVLGLIRHPYPPAIPELCALLGDKDRQLAGLARQALTACGGEAVPALLRAAQNADAGARLQAYRALAEISDPLAIPIFFKALQEGDSALIEHWSEYGLEKLGLGMTFFDP